ncbi:PP2C family protein-serine/threonine phosphatase [Thermodesulfobacteriota bacterium]
MKSLEHTFKTHIGSQGRENGDSYLFRDNLFVVVEGVGREYLGETAREQAYRIIPEAFFENLSETNSPGTALIHALEEANKSILAERRRLGEKMAASVSVVYIKGKIMYFTHLGDSRIYSFQGGELSQLTRDHTLREEDPFAEKRFNDPRALRALTEGLGINEKPAIKVKKYPLHRKGLILMTTEGLTERISNREILWLARKIKNPKKLCNNLVDLNMRKGGAGNITVGILKFGGLSKWLRNILFTYSAVLLIILAIITGYVMKYSESETDRAKVEVIQPIKEKAAFNIDKPKVSEKIIMSRPAKKVEDVPPQPVKKSIRERIVEDKAVKETGAELYERIYLFIGDWKSAWENTAGENGNIEKYISFYSTEFRANRLDKEGWKRDKVRKGRKKQWVRIGISDIKISGPTEENRIEVRFNQDYRSSNFSVRSGKLLILRKEGNEWKIITERSY